MAGGKELTREECLQLDIEVYNRMAEMSWERIKVERNLSGDLSACEHCGRKYSICCICDEARKVWDEMMAEIHEVQVNRDKKNRGIPRRKQAFMDFTESISNQIDNPDNIVIAQVNMGTREEPSATPMAVTKVPNMRQMSLAMIIPEDMGDIVMEDIKRWATILNG